MGIPTINDLYSKYTGKVGRTLENDRYFQYLYAMVESSQNVFQHKNHVLHKVVDERWLTTIEDSIKSINKIIEKPRRFIATKEEVVPVALAKKITADSVRHLSMNTQFIASDENGDIQPTRVLNVSTEESYDLYENRFIYHLIQRLITFIDKRTDIIFWQTGDETKNTMTFESHIDDAYEQIDYKVEINIKNLQSTLENDTDNMNVFMRIDHIRRLVLSLRNSSFCEIMAGCAKVRSPIQRTNLMMKDPDYRTCYKLWQFLESYEEVGYTIDDQVTALEFDEEYMIQMYTNLITNYTVFKSLLETDQRRIEEAPKKHRIIKPKFIKTIKEEFVDNRDLEDVEIRQVFLEEVTEAQLEAEAKAKELQELYENTASERDQAMLQADQYFMQVNALMQAQAEYEEALEMERNAKAALEIVATEELEAEKARSAKELEEANAKAAKDLEEAHAKAEADLAAKQGELDAAMLKAADELNMRLNEFEASIAHMTERINEKQAELDIAKEKAAKELAAKDEEIAKVNEALEAKKAELDDTLVSTAKEVNDAKEALDKAVADKELAEQNLEATKAECKETLNQYKREAANQLAIEREASDTRFKEAAAEHEKELAYNSAAYEEKIEALKKDSAKELEDAKAEAEDKINKVLIDNEAKINDIKKDFEEEKKTLNQAHASEIAELNKKHEEALEGEKKAFGELREQDKLEAEEARKKEAKERERSENLLRMNIADAEKESTKLQKQVEELEAKLKESESLRLKAEERLNQRRGLFGRRRKTDSKE